ncbi:hypothetical protein M5K25_005119 [Dendrobium thyrsiflorum]|uniref:PH domain-containing protein n=1 Tax=Dendrobium thyrsiflorum TaxID=117978 RepID=A0ABD0VHH6_DENTH
MDTYGLVSVLLNQVLLVPLVQDAIALFGQLMLAEIQYLIGQTCQIFSFPHGVEIKTLDTDLSPQDTTMLVDIVEVGPLPSFVHEDEQRRHAFYILTSLGLRFECSSVSKMQVDSWLATIQNVCKLAPLKDPFDLEYVDDHSAM